MLGLIRSVPSIPIVWACEPLLVTLIVLFGVTSSAESLMANSDRSAVIVWPATAGAPPPSLLRWMRPTAITEPIITTKARPRITPTPVS